MCVPAHVGMEGNERVDKAANRPFGQNEVGVRVALGVSEWRGEIKERIMERWQGKWRVETRRRHFFHLQGSVWGERVALGMGKREQVLMTRLWLGNCGLAASSFWSSM